MADVRGFPGIRYHLARVGDLGSVVAPPYDVIAEADLESLRSRSPYNVVRLTRPGTNYTSAARTFEDWRQEGVLSSDPTSMYVHEVVFDGRRRRDLIAAVRLQPYSDRVVLPHELTHRGPKEDRLALMRATGLSLEPLWFLHERNEEVRNYVSIVAARAPAATFQGTDSTEHRFWTVTDPAVHAAIHSSFNGLEGFLIADGHHRYETALAYAEETGGAKDSASRFTLALLTELDDPGLEVLPTHRVMKAGVAVIGGEDVGSLDETLAALRGRVAAGAYRDHRFQVLPLEGEVAVVELHRQVIDNIAGKRNLEELVYTRDPAEAVRWVDEGAGTAAFFLDTPDLGQVLKLAREGKTPPQKSTYFHPKPPSGMVFLRLDKVRPL